MNIIIAAVPSRAAGLNALDRLQEAVDDGSVTVEDAAMAYKTEKGKVKLHQTTDATGGKGAWKGGALGLLVGVVSAPIVPAVAVGAVLGGIVGRARDRGVSDKLMKQAGDAIQSSGAAVFVLADDASTLLIAAMIEEAIAEGVNVEYDVFPQEAQDFLREAIRLSETL